MKIDNLHVAWFNPDSDDTPRLCDPQSPLLPVTSDAAGRGFGVFETIAVLSGKILNLEAHLERMCMSARRLNFKPINPERFRTAILHSAQKIADRERAGLRVVYAKNTPQVTAPSMSQNYLAWIVAFALDPADTIDGIGVITLQRGVKSDAGHKYPWLLFGAKTTSYAVNMYALEVAAARGADDAVFVSEDGLLLEGTTSNLIVYDGEAFMTPCPKRMSILPGTTQKRLFDLLQTEGKTVIEDAIPIERLYNSNAVWLVSSVRMVTSVISVDNRKVCYDPPLTHWLNDLLIRSAV